MSSELDALIETLQQSRASVLRRVGGLDEATSRRVLAPSGWSILGQIQHLTMNERYWLRWAVGGESIPGVRVHEGRCEVVLEDLPDDNEWFVPEHLSAATVLERYRLEGEASDRALAGVDVGGSVRQLDPVWSEWFNIADPRHLDVRSVLYHVMTHATEHAGQIDVGLELWRAERAS